MNVQVGRRSGAMVVALSLGLASMGVAHAQQGGGGPGYLQGEVDKCVNGNETPVPGVSVGVAGASAAVKTDANGLFLLVLAPGQYTIQATADDGTTGSRPYVPVDATQTLDIGVLELAGGCGGDNGGPAPAPAQPAAQPTAPPPTATAVPATPAPAVAPPTATPVPAAPEQPADQSPPPSDTGSDAGSGG